jgi:hypothetical protein
MPTPKSTYLVRTPADRRFPITAGQRFGNKRLAIKRAQTLAGEWRYFTPVRDRRISVYIRERGLRPSLLYQCHADRKTGRIVSEVL